MAKVAKSKLVAPASALALLALVFALVAWRYSPPPPRPASSTPPEQFSAERALDQLRALLGRGEAPHPVGSRESAAVRRRIVARLRALGLAPRVRSRWVCGSYDTCALTHNVVARIAGRTPGAPAMMLAVHYDSVQAGPGASDDGVGVAVALEIARVLTRRGARRHRNPIVLLFDDGEEEGLLGAEAFAHHDPLRRSVRYVVNVEARGTGGPSMMFETHERNGAIVRLFASATPRPVTSSAFYAVYKKLPNDTDFTVFKRHGVGGVNFAYVGGVTRYHTPLDNLAHVSLASMQHHGDHALAMLRALADADARALVARGDAVFFDVLALFVVCWPLDLTLPLAVAALLAQLLACVLLVRRRRLRLAQLGWGLLVALVGLLLPLALGAGLWLILRNAGALDGFFPASPAFSLICFVGLAFVGVLPWWRRRAGVVGCWLGAWLFWSLAAVVLASVEAGLAYPALLPSLLAGILAGVWLGRAAAPSRLAAAGGARLGAPLWLALLLPGALAARMLLPIAWMLYSALGLVAPPAFTALVALTLLPLGPLLAWPLHAAPRGDAAPRPPAAARWALPAMALALALAGFVGAAVSSPFDADNPQRLSIAYVEDADSGRARYFVDGFWSGLPDALRRVLPFGKRRRSPYEYAPFYMRKSYLAEAPRRRRLRPPEVEVLERTPYLVDRRRVRLRLRSPSGARVATLVLPRGLHLRRLRIGGALVRSAGRRWTPGYRSFSVRSLPPGGVEIELELARRAPVPLVVVEQRAGLGDDPLAKRLEAARPRWATASQDGDISLVVRRFQL